MRGMRMTHCGRQLTARRRSLLGAGRSYWHRPSRRRVARCWGTSCLAFLALAGRRCSAVFARGCILHRLRIARCSRSCVVDVRCGRCIALLCCQLLKSFLPLRLHDARQLLQASVRLSQGAHRLACNSHGCQLTCSICRVRGRWHTRTGFVALFRNRDECQITLVNLRLELYNLLLQLTPCLVRLLVCRRTHVE